MSTPHQTSLTSAHVPAQRFAVPPYAAPASAAPALAAPQRVRPFIPEPWRTAIAASEAIASEAIPAAVVSDTTVAEANLAETSAETMGAVPSAVEASALVAGHVEEQVADAPTSFMAVPERIPPYRPLRPTPIMTPAIRTPLYIPSIPVPAAEVAPEDEGVIAPELLTTAEFALPLSLRPTLSSVEAVAVPDTAPQSEGDTELADFAEQGSAAPEAVTPPTLATDGAQELPWIEAFLAATPAVPMRSVPTPLVSEIIEAAEPEAPVEEVVADPADEWPLQEAAEEFRAFSAQLDSPADVTVAHAAASEEALPDADAPDALFAATAEPAPLPAWSDDDLMDIMPIRHSGKTPLSNPAVMGDGDLWAERARKAQEEAQVLSAMTTSPSALDASAPESTAAESTAAESTAEEAAHALELLARRVRAGELMLPSYDPRMGEPAALVAALAALLGVRLR